MHTCVWVCVISEQQYTICNHPSSDLLATAKTSRMQLAISISGNKLLRSQFMKTKRRKPENGVLVTGARRAGLYAIILYYVLHWRSALEHYFTDEIDVSQTEHKQQTVCANISREGDSYLIVYETVIKRILYLCVCFSRFTWPWLWSKSSAAQIWNTKIMFNHNSVSHYFIYTNWPGWAG